MCLLACLAIGLTACGSAGALMSSTAAVEGQAPSPVVKSFNVCPKPTPLSFNSQARANARTTVRKAIPVLYRSIKTVGFRITMLDPATSTATSSFGGLVKVSCGLATQRRTYIAELVFPAMLPSASLSQGVLYLSRFEHGWEVWGEFPPGPQSSSTSTASPTSTTSTTAVPGTTLSSTPPESASGPIYLALGDSAPIWNGNASYPNLIAAHYRSSVPGLELVNLAVSGETTTSMLDSADQGAASQQQQAVTFLHAHQGNIALITIDIGGNDILPCASETASSAAVNACIQKAETQAVKNLVDILGELRQAAGSSVRIIGMTYYDPYLGDWLAGGSGREAAIQSVPALVRLNDLLAQTYRAADVQVADVQAAFQSTDLTTSVESPWGTVPIAVDQACSLLDIECQKGRSEGFGDDPNAAGARVIAKVFQTTIGPLKPPG